jgi:hypothetical protein
MFGCKNTKIPSPQLAFSTNKKQQLSFWTYISLLLTASLICRKTGHYIRFQTGIEGYTPDVSPILLNTGSIHSSDIF